MIPVRQSTAFETAIGPVLDADGVAVTGCVVGDFKIKKTSGNFAALNGSATLTHVSAGVYDLVLTTSDVDTVGLACIAIDDTVNACASLYLQVMEEAVYDALYAASANAWSGAAGSSVGSANVTQWLGTAAATPTVEGVPEVDVTHYLGSAAPALVGGRFDSSVGAMAANVLTAAAAATDFGAEIQALITGGAYTLSTDANGRIRIVDGTGTGELDTSSGRVQITEAQIDQIVDETWDEDATGHQTQGTFGQTIGDSTTGVSLYTEAAVLRNSLVAAQGIVIDSTGATTTSFRTDLTQVDDYWNDALLTFTSGALIGQTRTILDFANTNGVITLDEALTDAPANGVTASILAAHVHPVTQIADAILDRSASGHTTNSTLGAIINDLEDGGRTDLLIDAILDDTGTAGVVLTSTGLATSAVEEIRNAITGGAYALDTDASGRVRIVDGTAAGELDTASGLVKISGTIQTLDALDTAQDVEHDSTQALIAALNNLSAAQVLTQVETALATTTRTMPGQVTPSTTPTLAEAIMQIFQRETNPMEQDSTEQRIYNRAGTVVHQKRTVGELAGTTTVGAIATGP